MDSPSSRSFAHFASSQVACKVLSIYKQTHGKSSELFFFLVQAAKAALLMHQARVLGAWKLGSIEQSGGEIA